MTVTYTHEVADARLGGFSNLLLRWRGSVYKLFYKEFLIYVALYTTISLIYRLSPSSEFKMYFEKLCLQFQNYTSEIPISFVLGFYVAIVVGRWWSQYENIPWPDRLMVILCSTVHGADDRGRLIRRTLVRYLHLMQVLTYRSISTAVFKRFPSIQHVVNAGFMTKSELKMYNEVQSHNLKYWIPSVWFSNLVSKVRQEGRILDDMTYNLILQEMNTFRGCCGSLISYDWISIPLVYTQMLNLPLLQVVTVAVYMYFFCTLISSQFLDTSMGYVNHSIDLYIPIVTIGQFFFYVGWLKVAEQLINPFGEDDDDFEVNGVIDRNLEIAFLAVDGMYMKHPKLEKDLYWNTKTPEAPYTAASKSHRVDPFMGSTYDMHVTKDASHFLDLPHHDKQELNNNSDVENNININNNENTMSLLQNDPCIKESDKTVAIDEKVTEQKTIVQCIKLKFENLKQSLLPKPNIFGSLSSENKLLSENKDNLTSDEDDDVSDDDAFPNSEESDDDINKNHLGSSRCSSLSSVEDGNNVKSDKVKISSKDEVSYTVAQKKMKKETSKNNKKVDKNSSDASRIKPTPKKRNIHGKFLKRSVIHQSEGDTEQERRNALLRVKPGLKMKKKSSMAMQRNARRVNQPASLWLRKNSSNNARHMYQSPSDSMFSMVASSPSPKLLRWAFKSKNRNLYDDMADSVSMTSSMHSVDDNESAVFFPNSTTSLLTKHNINHPLQLSPNLFFSNTDAPTSSPNATGYHMPFTEDLRKRLLVHGNSPVANKHISFPSSAEEASQFQGIQDSLLMISPTYTSNLEVIGEHPNLKSASQVSPDTIISDQNKFEERENNTICFCEEETPTLCNVSNFLINESDGEVNLTKDTNDLNGKKELTNLKNINKEIDSLLVRDCMDSRKSALRRSASCGHSSNMKTQRVHFDSKLAQNDKNTLCLNKTPLSNSETDIPRIKMVNRTDTVQTYNKPEQFFLEWKNEVKNKSFTLPRLKHSPYQLISLT